MILTLAGWLLTAAAAAAQETRAEEPGDWPSFLGPDHNGISRETGLLKAWPPEGPPVVWTRELGETYAVPSIVRGALVVFLRFTVTPGRRPVTVLVSETMVYAPAPCPTVSCASAASVRVTKPPSAAPSSVPARLTPLSAPAEFEVTWRR
jgi:hypothetical protein